MLERTRLLDDAERFERAWPALREGAAEIGVPELHAPGHRLVAELGERLEAAEGLDAGARLVVAEWRKIEAAQTALAEEVGTGCPRMNAAARKGVVQLVVPSVPIADDPNRRRKCRIISAPI